MSDYIKQVLMNRPINNPSKHTHIPAAPTPGCKNDGPIIRDSSNHHDSSENDDLNAVQPILGHGIHSDPAYPRPAHPSPPELFCETEYTEEEQQRAKEQLRIVRRNLKRFPSDSSYFKRFAPLVDDWRNFLPSNRLLQQQQQQPHQRPSSQYDRRHRRTSANGCEKEATNTGTKSLLSRDSKHNDFRGRSYPSQQDEDDNSYDEYSLDEELGAETDENDSIPPMARYGSSGTSLDHPPAIGEFDALYQGNYVTAASSCSSLRRMESSSSFVKELLREEELCRLVTSSHLHPESNDAESNNNSADQMLGERPLLSRVSDSYPHYSHEYPNTHSKGLLRQQRSCQGLMTHGEAQKQEFKDISIVHRSSLNHLRSNSACGSKGSGSLHRARSHDVRRHEVSQGHKRHPCHAQTEHRRRQSSNSSSQSRNVRRPRRQRQHAGGIGFVELTQKDGDEVRFTLGLESEGEDTGSEDSMTYLISSGEVVDSSQRPYPRLSYDAIAGTLRYNPGINEYESQTSFTSPSNDDAASVVSRSSSSSAVSTVSTTASDRAAHGSIIIQEEPPQYSNHGHDQALFSDKNQPFASTAHCISRPSTTAPEMKEDSKQSTKVKNTRPSLTVHTTSYGTAFMEGGIAPGALSAYEKPVGSQYSLTKCNSTSSLYIDSTMTKSDVDETLRAVATVLFDKVLQSHKDNDVRTERIVNSSSYVHSDKVLMSHTDIFDFMRFIFDCGQNLGAENAIITLIYVERMTELGNLSFHAINWRRLLLGALILSIKVWEDLAVFNSDVCAIFEGLAVKDVNALERFAMAKLQYNVSVKRSVYAACYFRLRDVSESHYNSHYGQLTISMSQRDIQGDNELESAHFQRRPRLMASRSNSNTKSSLGSNGGSSAGLMSAVSLSSQSNHSGSSISSHHTRVPVGPGYRKWTLKPLSVREADRLEARSSLYCSSMMMEEQERRGAGCCWDEYSSASSTATLVGRSTPEELCSISNSLANSIATAGSSMHTLSSMTTSASSGYGHELGYGGKLPSAIEGGSKKENDGSQGVTEDDGATTTRRVLRMKKSRSDFFFQNTTPASIM
ncbi:hypothetical protein BGW38_003701 [Lunasporangiospora selenospora]|uniref:Cyclin N-terminal domain-containing protein n=1 Tax=Lunasporangiospora selenospora TaxID=979761 RepID=A0A9P6G0H6_9FUNG|nr:hypothetical protein BGW38_003701 [Lunasporangiospora selenospora]